MKKLYLISIMLLFLSACSNASSDTEELMESFPHPETTEIIYEQQMDDHQIVVYEDETGFRVGYKKQGDKNWTHTSKGDINPDDGFDWVMNNNPTVPITLFGGTITNDEITTVVVKQKTMEKEATIIKTDDGLRYWFLTFNTLEDSDPGEPDPLKIEAFDKNGNVLWKDGVYEDGYYSGAIAS